MRCTRIAAAIGLLTLMASLPAYANNIWDYQAKKSDFICSDTYGAITINSNVVVPPGKICTLLGTTVKGGVKALLHSQFYTDNGTTIKGNVRGLASDNISIVNSEVGGNVVQRSAQTISKTNIDASKIGGNVLYFDNGPYNKLNVNNSAIKGDLTIQRNQVFDSINVFSTAIKGTVFLLNNSVAPPTPKGNQFIFLGHDVIFGGVISRGNNPSPNFDSNFIYGGISNFGDCWDNDDDDW